MSLTLALKGGSRELAGLSVYPISDPSVKNTVSENKLEGDGELIVLIFKPIHFVEANNLYLVKIVVPIYVKSRVFEAISFSG